MRKITNEVTGNFKPAFIITGYNHDDNFYLEHHPVNAEGQVLAGKPLDHKTVDNLLKKLTVQKKKSEQKPPFGPIPENMFYLDNTRKKYVWVAKSGPRPLYFQKGLNIPDGVANVPNLVFVANGASLLVFAIKKIGLKSKLCYAPFHNTSDNGSVCQGSAKASYRDNSIQAVVDYWETIFFGSVFTALHGTNPINGNINLMWKALIESGEKFDNSVLIETKTTLEDLLK